MRYLFFLIFSLLLINSVFALSVDIKQTRNAYYSQTQTQCSLSTYYDSWQPVSYCDGNVFSPSMTMWCYYKRNYIEQKHSYVRVLK